MPAEIDLQNDDELESIPDAVQFQLWVDASLAQSYDRLEQTIRIVGEAESRALNSQYRARDVATNVLSFPAQSDYLDYDCLGDLVICAPLVEREANQQNKTNMAHWAHLVIHGMLHLQGFDHQTNTEAETMEALEVKILSTLGYPNPYNSPQVSITSRSSNG